MKKRTDMKLENGRVYLRDTRNGTIHQYQPLLAEMRYMQRFIAGEETSAQPIKPDAKIQLSGTERAAEFDRLASMTAKQRAALEAQKAEQAKAQQKADSADPDAPPKKTYRMTAKAGGVKYDEFKAQGWMVEDLIKEGYMEEVSAPNEL